MLRTIGVWRRAGPGVLWHAWAPDIGSVASVGIFLGLTVALMGPVLVHPDERLYGIGGDGPGAAAGIARRLQAVANHGLFAPLPTLLAAPFGQPAADGAADPLWWYSGALLARVFTPVAATNAMIFIAFIATAIATLTLLRSQRFSPGAALLGAIIYAFCPLRLAEAQEHYLLLDGFWLVAECALLLLVRGRSAWLASAGIGLIVGLTELDNPYLGYFGGLLAGGWLLAWGIRALVRRDWRVVWQTAVSSLLMLFITAVVVIPTQLPLLGGATSTGNTDGSQMLVRSLGDLDRLSLRWWNFLLPSPDNPLLGPLARGAFYDHLGVNTVSEQSTMVGYVALCLAIIGILATIRHRLAPLSAAAVLKTRGPLIALAVACIVTGIAFGVPPSFQLGPVLLPTPPAFMHWWFPQIRTTSRIDVLIQLGIAIFAAIGAERALSGPRYRGALTVALLTVILLEYTNVPPWRYVALMPAPAVETWLATLPADTAGIVAQYPIAASDMARTPVLEFYAYSVHHHPLFNGVVRDTPPDALRRNLQDLLNPTIPAAWSALGVKTITIERSYYRPYFGNAGLQWDGEAGKGAVLQLPVGLVERYADGSSSGYAVTPPPAPVVAGLGAGFGNSELGDDGRLWQWMGEQATMWLDNRTDHSVSVAVWTLAHDNGGDHSLAWAGYLPSPVPAAQAERPVALAVQVGPGFHDVALAARGPLTPLAGGGGTTPVSVQLRSFEPEPIRPLTATFEQSGRPRWDLMGASVDACTIQAGQRLDVALLWRVIHPTDSDQTVFLHLIGPDGVVVATGDGPPSDGTVSSASATSVGHIADVHTLVLPRTLAPGKYQLEVGLYNHETGVRLRTTSAADAVELGAVAIVPPSPGPPRQACPW